MTWRPGGEGGGEGLLSTFPSEASPSEAPPSPFNLEAPPPMHREEPMSDDVSETCYTKPC